MKPNARQRLDKSAIAAKALEIIDRDGLVGLSMRRLGAALGVEGMALYRHYPEKDAILEQVVELVLEGIRYPEGGLGWQEKLRTVADALRERQLAHPNAMPLVAAHWLRTPALCSVLADSVADMRSVGLDTATAASVVHAVISFVLGHCWVEVGAFVGHIPDVGGVTRRPISPLDLEDERNLSSLQFEAGLEFILEGARNSMIKGRSRSNS